MSVTGGVEIILGGKSHTLRYTNRALMKLEIALARLRKDYEPGNIQVTNFMVWAGLLHEAKPFTVDQIGDLLEPWQYEDISKAATEAMVLATQKPGAEEPKENDPKVMELTA